MGKIASDDAQVGIGMVFINAFNTSLKPLTGVKAVKICAAWHQMCVGNLNDFHGFKSDYSVYCSASWCIPR
jgi:hypothetical protein